MTGSRTPARQKVRQAVTHVTEKRTLKESPLEKIEILADLKRLHSPDVDYLEQFSPNGPFGILVQAMVGPAGGEGEESFDIVVCTPEWFAQKMTSAVVPGRHFLFVRSYNYDALVSYLREYCNSLRGSSWRSIAEKVGRIGKWEFEDYVPWTDKSGDGSDEASQNDL